MSKWASAGSQRCDREATPYRTALDGTTDLACSQRDNCSTGAEVVHCTWNGAHDRPKVGATDLGNEIIWEFFARHSRHQGAPGTR